MFRNTQRGVTVLEVLVAMAIVAIIATATIPSFSHLLWRNQADSAIYTLYSAIQLTRHSALSFKTIVTLCPSDNGSQCGDDWSKGYMLFIDHNNNAMIDQENEQLIERIYPSSTHSRLTWRASAGRNFLRFSPTGMAREFGRFTYCHHSKDLRFAREIVINRQGRSRLSRDRNGDGIVENRSGKAPSC